MSKSDHHRPRLRSRLLRAAAGLLVLLAVVGYFAAKQDSTGGQGAPHCTVRAAGAGAGDSYSMTTEQAGNAATIAAVGTGKPMPERAVTIAIATAMQESALRNLDHGDRDSLGLFQQRPSQGWGTPEQIRDPVYSAGIFYDRLKAVRGWARLPLTEAAQQVQLSGFPQAYAKHEPDATLLAAAFTGAAPGTLTCTGPAPRPGTGDPRKVQAELTRVFGEKTAPRLGPPASSAGHSGPMERTEITVPVAAKKGAAVEGQRGWELAHWAVANAAELNISRVAYDGKAWIAGENKGRWVDRAPGTSGTGDPLGAGPEDVRIFVVR
ncbi:hypothetical protein OG625_13250 [Streptomyces sp. NBC_01351]|uniref:hypothetical protein n=1 Tax=Streptomyces sp. NBC_01351 TaxID=2903833 RepID=UPI002E3331A5|nr:hypothetical protein [Streptomyces sp. NBC_01351]